MATTTKKKPRARRLSFGRIRQESSKRWAAAYLHRGALHRAPATFPNKESGVAWLVGERKLIDLGTWTPPSQRRAKEAATRLTFGEYAKRWIEHRPIAPGTRSLYLGLLQQHLDPTFGTQPLDALTPDGVRVWFSGLGTDHPTRNSHAYGLLGAICATAADDDLIDRNPCRIKGGATVKQAAREVVLLDPAELAVLAEKMPEELRMAVLLAGWCGLRRGEVLALTREDIAEGSVRINKGVTVVDRKFVCGPPKTRESNRVVTVPTHIRAGLVEHLENHVGAQTGSLLFPDPVTGSFYTEGRFRGPFNAARTAIGREGLHFHDLRHFGGVMAALTGATTKEVMSRLGHVTAGTAMRYQHVAAGRADVIADRLSALAQTDS